MSVERIPAIRIMTLLLWLLAVPMAPMAADAPAPQADPGAANSAPAAPSCREEVYTGSRIVTLLCPGDVGYERGSHTGEVLQRPGDRQFTRSTRFPGVTVHSGAITGISVHQ